MTFPLPFTRDRVDWGEDNYLTTVPPVDTSDTLDFPVFPFYDAHDGSPENASHPERKGMWAGYDSTEDGLLHRLTPETSPRCARAPLAPRPARVFRQMNRANTAISTRPSFACKRAWDAVEGSFLDAGAEDIVDTIMPGMPRRHLEDLAAFLGRVRKAPSSPLHPDIELLYRLRVGGQVVYVSPCCPVVEGLDYRAPDERELCTFPMGLFGGHFSTARCRAFDSRRWTCFCSPGSSTAGCTKDSSRSPRITAEPATATDSSCASTRATEYRTCATGPCSAPD